MLKLSRHTERKKSGGQTVYLKRAGLEDNFFTFNREIVYINIFSLIYKLEKEK